MVRELVSENLPVTEGTLKRFAKVSRSLGGSVQFAIDGLTGRRRFEDLGEVGFILGQQLLPVNVEGDNYLYPTNREVYDAVCDVRFGKIPGQGERSKKERNFIVNLPAAHRSLARRIRSIQDLSQERMTVENLPRYFQLRMQFLTCPAYQGLSLADFPRVISRELSFVNILGNQLGNQKQPEVMAVEAPPIQLIEKPAMPLAREQRQIISRIERKGSPIPVEEIAYGDFSAPEIYLLSFLLAVNHIRRNGIKLSKDEFVQEGEIEYSRVERSPIEEVTSYFFLRKGEHRPLEDVSLEGLFHKLRLVMDCGLPEDVLMGDIYGKYDGRIVMDEFKTQVMCLKDMEDLYRPLVKHGRITQEELDQLLKEAKA